MTASEGKEFAQEGQAPRIQKLCTLSGGHGKMKRCALAHACMHVREGRGRLQEGLRDACIGIGGLLLTFLFGPERVAPSRKLET
jgi:hypothetical protein